MDLINIDLGDIDDGTEPIPDQAHVLFRNTSNVSVADGKSGFPYINVQAKPVEGQVDPKHQHKSVWNKLSFSPAALWHLKLYCLGLGIKSIKGKSYQELAEMFKGREFYADLTTEVAPNGNKVNKFAPRSYKPVA